MKKIIILSLILTSFDLYAGKDRKIELSSSIDELNYVKNCDQNEFVLIRSNYGIIQDHYNAWLAIGDAWASPYIDVKTLTISTRKTIYDKEHLEFMPELFPNVTELSIQKTQMTEDIFLNFLNKYKINLEILNLSGCNISNKSYYIKKLKNLKKLYLPRNDIKSLDFLPENLTHLDISSNPFKKQEILNIYKESPALQELTLPHDTLNPKTGLKPKEIKTLWLNLKELTCLKIGDKLLGRPRR